MFLIRLKVDSDLREIKDLLYSMDRKLDLMMDRGDTLALMRVSESSLRRFLLDEPDIYTVDDVKR